MMRTKLITLNIILFVLGFSISNAQTTNWNVNKLGTCSATCVPLNISNANTNNAKGGGNNTINNANGNIATNYFASACGLNYAIGKVKTGQRFFPAGSAQPAPISIVGIPACRTILKAFLYTGGSGNGIAFSATLQNPALTSSVFPMTQIGNDADKCWGYSGTYNYRADITALITGNGNYNVSGIPTSNSTPGNDMDGVTIIIIYTDPTQAYTGHILIGDGCEVGIGGTKTNTLTGWSACAASTFANAFMIVSDMQNVGPFNLSMNSPVNNFIYPNGSQDWWDDCIMPVAPAVTAGQNTAAWECTSNSGDCFNIVAEGLYYRTACLACAVVPLAVTTATTSSCTVGSATAFATGGTGPYTYSWTPSALTTSAINNVATGNYTVTIKDATGCTTVTAIVTIPATSATLTTSSKTVCLGSAATLTVSGANTYTWQPGNVIGSSVTFTPLATTVYTVIGTSAGGCTASITATITINPLPVVLPTSNSPICTGGTINLSVGAATSYTWAGPNGFSSNAQNPSINNVTAINAGNYTITVTSALGCTASAVTNVIVNPTPTITPSNTGPYCAGTTIQLNVAAAASYTWTGPNGFNSNAQNPAIPNAQAINAGVYTVTVTAVGGCMSTGTTTVVINPSPTITVNSATICLGGNATLNAGGASTYTWQPGNINATSVTFFPVITTVYTITGTSASGCTASTTATITVNPLPVVLPSSNSPICTGGTLNLTVGAATSYTWAGPNGFSSNAQNPTINNVTAVNAGNYTVTLTSAQGCTASATTNVIVNPTPTITPSNTGPYCAGATIQLNVAAAASYTWTGPNVFNSNAQNPTIPNAQAVNAGVYTVTVTAVGGCKSTGTTTVVINPLPLPNANSNSPVCLGNPINFTGLGGVTYTWTGPNAFNSNAQNPSIAVAALVNAGNYTLTVTNASGCTNSVVTNVVVNPLPVVLVNSPTVCVGSPFNLTASAGSTAYAWTGPNAYNSALQNPPFASASTTMSGNYTVVVTSAQGCTNSAVANVLVVTLPTVSIVGTNTLCSQNFNGSPNTVVLTASGAATFTWTLPAGYTANPNLNSANVTITPSITAVQNITTVSVIGSAGTCTSGAVFTLTVQPNPTITATSASMCAGTSVTLTAANASTYTWSPAATLNTANGPIVIASPAVTTVYSIIGSSVGCNSQTQNATASVVPNPTVTILPNPAVICLGNSINLTASGATIYTWTPNTALTTTNVATTTASPTITTTYSVLGSQSTCTNLATITVSVLGLPSITVTPSSPTLCMNNFNGSPNTVSLTASGAGSYTWGPIIGLTTNTINGATIIGTSNGAAIATGTVIGANGTCTSSSTFTINAIPNPTIAVTSASMCAGTSATLFANNATTYTWSPAASLNSANNFSVIATPSITTIYSVIGSSVGCNSQTQNGTAIVVINPTVTIVPANPVICLGNSINLTASGATIYTWTPNTALTTTNTPNTTANPTITTTYSVLGSQSTCTNLATITVTVLGLPSITVTPSSPTLCMNNFNGSPNTVSLTATGAITFTWGPIIGLTTNTLNGATIIGTSNGAAIATGTVIGANGTCSNVSTFTVNAVPNPTITVSSGSMCAGTSVALTANNATTYTWTPTASLNVSNGPNVIASPAITTVYSVIGSSVGCNSQTQNGTAVVVANPTVSIAPITPTICFGNAINLSAAGAVNYTWSPNTAISSTVGTNVIVNPTVTTTYSIIGEQSTCTNTAVRTVTVISLPIITINLNTPNICMNNFNGSTNTVNINANGATTYTWIGFNGLTANTTSGAFVVGTAIPNAPIGTGTVIGFVGTCSNVASFSVIEIPNPIITVPSASMCAGTSVVLNAAGATTYVWAPSVSLSSPFGSSVIASPNVTTVYGIVGTSLNCNSTTQLSTVTVVANPTIMITPLNPTICAGSSIGLSGSGATSYTWSPAASLDNANNANVIATPANTTIYTLIGSANACTAFATRQVTVVPLPTLQAICEKTAICQGDQTIINANGANSYTWNPSTGLSSATSNFVIANPQVSTVYALIGTNGLCTATLVVPITVIPKPVLELTTSNPRICIGNSSSIFASGCQGYSWTPTGDANQTNTTMATVTPSATTNYTVTGYNYSGTTACVFTKEIQIEIVPQVTASISNSVAICEGESVQLKSGGSNTYIWSPAMGLNNALTGSPYANPKSTTVYTVQISNGGFCGTTATVLVQVNPQPTVDAGPDMTYNLDDPMYLNARGTGTLTWIFGENILCHDCPNSQIMPTTSSAYRIQAINNFGCIATDDVNVEVTNDYSIYIPNIFTPNYDGLNDVFLVYGTGITKLEMFIFDRWGAKLYTTTDQLKGWDGVYQGELSKDDVYVYLVNFTTLDNKTHTKTGHVTLMK